MKYLQLYETFNPANIYEGKLLVISDAIAEWAIRFFNDEVDFLMPPIPKEIFKASKNLALQYSKSRGTKFGYTPGYIYRGTKKDPFQIKEIKKQRFYQPSSWVIKANSSRPTLGISSWTWDYETSQSFSDTLTAVKIKGNDPIDDKANYGMVARLPLDKVEKIISMDVIMDNITEEQRDRLIHKDKQLDEYFYNYTSESELLVLEPVKIPLSDLQIEIRKHLR